MTLCLCVHLLHVTGAGSHCRKQAMAKAVFRLLADLWESEAGEMHHTFPMCNRRCCRTDLLLQGRSKIFTLFKLRVPCVQAGCLLQLPSCATQACPCTLSSSPASESRLRRESRRSLFCTAWTGAQGLASTLLRRCLPSTRNKVLLVDFAVFCPPERCAQGRAPDATFAAYDRVLCTRSHSVLNL